MEIFAGNFLHQVSTSKQPRNDHKGTDNSVEENVSCFFTLLKRISAYDYHEVIIHSLYKNNIYVTDGDQNAFGRIAWWSYFVVRLLHWWFNVSRCGWYLSLALDPINQILLNLADRSVLVISCGSGWKCFFF